MRRILYLTFYYEPDLCAGSFRNSPLSRKLADELDETDHIHIVTTVPNRYNSFKIPADTHEKDGVLSIDRIDIPLHKSGFLDQIKSFRTYFFQALNLTRSQEYDLIFASSSRLFTAFLGAYLSKRRRLPLYLDIRDIFTDTLDDVLKSKTLKFVLLPFLRAIERFTFSNANHINLVSEGFEGYFSKYPKPSDSYLTNGIDDIFLNLDDVQPPQNDIPIVTYAGNIGEGQGLEKVIPQLAQGLPNYHFKIIGDGGTKHLLEEKVKEMGVLNVELISPVSRQELLKQYQHSDYLFLHLNDYEAFEKVLPSKIFEYGSFDIPMIAGVGGYAAQFIEQNVSNHILFRPGDYEDLIRQIGSTAYRRERRLEFRKLFSRGEIMRNMSKSIVSLLS